MATALAVAHRRDIRRLAKLRRERAAAERTQRTDAERTRHERLVVARMTKRIWRPNYAAFLGIPWDHAWPPAPPSLFDHYAYWQARRCGWDVLRKEWAGVWEWWSGLADDKRDGLADLRRGQILRTGDVVGEEMDPEQLLKGAVVLDVGKVAEEWGRKPTGDLIPS
jgi:hypothetical protein